jgi:hypothetical protein
MNVRIEYAPIVSADSQRMPNGHGEWRVKASAAVAMHGPGTKRPIPTLVPRSVATMNPTAGGAARMTQPTKSKTIPERKDSWPNEGEGNKSADRTYRKATEAFVKSGRVPGEAQKAADALESPEGEELREAERKGRKGHPKP